MTTPQTPGAPVADGTDIAWKIMHLTRSIRSREAMLTYTGFATPHTPEKPEVIAERHAHQVAVIADKRIELAYWEGIAAQTITPATD